MYERTYHAKVLKQNASEEKKRRRSFSWKKFFLVAGGVIAVAAIVVLIRSPRLQVSGINVIGTSVTDPEDVKSFVQSQIEGKYLYFFPKTSMLLVPTTTITKRVLHQFPRFASVDIRRSGLHGLAITVVEREEKYLWCESNESCFFMTAEGLVFAPAPFFSGDAYVRFFMGEKKALPFSPLSNASLMMVKTLLEQLPALGIVPTEFKAISEHEIDISFVHQGDKATLMIDPANDVEKTLEDLATGLLTEPLKGQFNDPKKVLEYLDARFANKVVYKFN